VEGPPPTIVYDLDRRRFEQTGFDFLRRAGSDHLIALPFALAGGLWMM
jgi:hypothetical protein